MHKTDTAADTKYLFKRNNTWWVKVAVPRSLRKSLGYDLRREARRGVQIGGLCTAGYALARAGLLEGKRATIHWENHDGFAEAFESVDLARSVYVIDGNRMTTAGWWTI